MNIKYNITPFIHLWNNQFIVCSLINFLLYFTVNYAVMLEMLLHFLELNTFYVKLIILGKEISPHINQIYNFLELSLSDTTQEFVFFLIQEF